ncbi:MAG: hypothetical protein HZB65_00760 [Candidatus Aenigmarchaeota archaeon]|nr:hypothetical protein [Candidatus Aenigmarchaeota archaeon]
MTFFSKKERRYDENEIKRAVESDPMDIEQFPMPVSHEKKIYEPSGVSVEAPLFIKVEKYREIAASVNEMRSFISGIKQIFLVMNEIQEVQQGSINILRASIQRLEKNMEWIDKALLKPAGFEELPQTGIESRQIEQSLLDLQREISSLKKDLERIS